MPYSRQTERQFAAERILLSTDGSHTARRATDHALAVARQCGSTLRILHVVDLQAASGLFDAGGLEPAFVERLVERGQRAVGAVAADAAETVPGPAVDTAVVHTKSFAGVAPEIRRHVESEAVDLVVVGTHGRSGFRRRVAGSVASSLLRTVDVPALVVP